MQFIPTKYMAVVFKLYLHFLDCTNLSSIKKQLLLDCLITTILQRREWFFCRIVKRKTHFIFTFFSDKPASVTKQIITLAIGAKEGRGSGKICAKASNLKPSSDCSISAKPIWFAMQHWIALNRSWFDRLTHKCPQSSDINFPKFQNLREDLPISFFRSCLFRATVDSASPFRANPLPPAAVCK